MAPPKALLVAGAICVYASGSALAYQAFRPPPACDVYSGGETFDSLADRYDSKVGLDEALMGLKLLRRWLVRQAQGNVLEISAGTGRNLPYYKLHSLSSLTITDASKHMLFHARQKHGASGSDGPPVQFRVADAAELCSHAGAPLPGRGAKASSRQPDGPHANSQLPMDAPLPEGHFDTVVDTFGLCSSADPVRVLQEVSRACKPDGRILLLEHGRASYVWLNRILDRDAAEHQRRWACKWNLPIDEIIEQAGLQVISQQRWHFGTTYMIVAAPGPKNTVQRQST